MRHFSFITSRLNMKRNLLCILLILPIFSIAQSQKDSTILLQPVNLKLHFSKQSSLSASSSVHTLNEQHIEQQQQTTLLTSMNSIAGVRMEERSPGSYRIAMRGNLIRSPFGIRNTKVYIDELPFTDAGGNTYLNLIDPSFVKQIDVIKGPDGSLYGANIGGIIRIEPKGFGEIDSQIALDLSTGSYGLFHQQLGIQQKVNTKYQFSLNQSFLTSDGYRDHTALHKKAFQTAHQWNYNPSSQIRLYALYTDLGYETPGGLTQSQYDSNPRQARPAAGPNPSAEAQKAAIYNKTLFGGLSHDKEINDYLTHHIAIYGSHTDFKNPFITNYEIRKEDNLGFRTYLSWNKKLNNKAFQMQLGAEATFGWNKIHNYDNNKGVAADLQAEDDLNNRTINVFYRAQLEILNNWNVEASVGLNQNNIDFKTYYPTSENGNIKFDVEWMPRIATTYVLNNMSWRLSYAKGYSVPTLSEVRSSDNIINVNLQAEKGNNYEVGYKIRSADKRLIFDLAAYNFKIKNGIIRQLNDAGIEYYSNVGEINQKGVEGTIWLYIPTDLQIIKSINYQGAVAYNHYRFGEYQVANQDLKGNKVTTVPDWVWTNTVFLEVSKSIQLNIYHNYTSSSPLNDANTVFSKNINLLQAKLIWTKNISPKIKSQLYLGVDNLLNERYSLGNDINAFGGRYFNVAPARNYYVGLRLTM